MYTTHGLMTPADMADYDELYDTRVQAGCPGHATLSLIEYCSVNDDPCPDDEDELEPF